MAPAWADGNFGSIQFSYSGGNHTFFDARSGDVWEHGDHGNFRNHYRINEPGKDHNRYEESGPELQAPGP